MTRRIRTISALSALLLITAAAGAGATPPVQTVSIHSLVLRDDVVPPISAGSRKFSFNVRSRLADPAHQSNAPAPGSDGDPTIDGASGGGGLLEVYNAAGSGEIVTVPLPAERWRFVAFSATEFRYMFVGDPPVWRVWVRGHKISIRGGKAAWDYTLDEPSQGAIAVRLTLGTGITYCSLGLPRISGTPPSSARSDRPGRFSAAIDQVASDSCPPLP